jgi:hypothetical protein
MNNGTNEIVSELIYIKERKNRHSFSQFLDNNRNISYFNIKMQIKISKFIPVTKRYLPLLMLVVLFSSITLAAFHNHYCTENSDRCIACNLQHSFSSITIESAAHSIIFPQPLSKSQINLNERITDPSQKIVCSSHAPPQFS